MSKNKKVKVEEPKKKKNTFKNVIMWSLVVALVGSVFLPALAGMM